MKRHRLTLISLLIGLVWIEVIMPRLVRAQGEQTPLAQADAQVRAGHYPEALAAALEAIEREPNNFRAYYYAAFALYKQGRLEDAAPYAQKALERAPDTSKAEVQRLVDAIAGFRSRDQYVQAAAEAEQSGLFAKAADIYARGWKAAPDQSQDLGLKAAHIWVERIPQPLRAAEILNYVAAHPQQPGYLEDAQRMLQALQGPLRGVYTNDFNRGLAMLTQKKPEDGLALFTEAAQAEPQERAPHYMMAQAYMMLNRRDEAMKEVMTISRMGGDANEMMQSNVWRESLYPLGTDAKYASTLEDAFGPQLIAQATAWQQQNDKQAETQRREQEAKAEARGRLASDLGLLRQQLSGSFEYRENASHYPYIEEVKRDVQSSATCELVVHEDVKRGSTDKCKYSRDIEVPLNEPLTVDLAEPGSSVRVRLPNRDVKWQEVGRHSGGPFNACHYNDENDSSNRYQAQFLLHDANQVNTVISLLKDVSLACAP